MGLQRQVAKGGVCWGGEETDKSRGTARGHPGCLPGAPQALKSAEITALRRDGNPRAGQEGEERGGLPAPHGGPPLLPDVCPTCVRLSSGAPGCQAA